MLYIACIISWHDESFSNSNTLNMCWLLLQMLQYVKMAEEADMELAGMWIQDWAGEIFTDFGKRVFWNWEWNDKLYPGNVMTNDF